MGWSSSQGIGRQRLRTSSTLQLPKPGATTARTRRPIALLPMLYRIWAATRKWDLQVWRDKQRGLGHRPVGEGALDTAFLLAREAEANSAKGRPFGAIFLDCSKCYERVNLAHLHSKLQEAQVPKHLIAPALNMYHAAATLPGIGCSQHRNISYPWDPTWMWPCGRLHPRLPTRSCP